MLKVWDQKINWWWDWWHCIKDDNELWSLLWKSYDARSYPLAIWSIIRVRFSKANFKSLQRVAPIEFDARRRDISEKTYPIPYYASYFGYKIHMDQNEKTTMLWVHTCCHDRCLLTNGLWIWDDGNKESNSYIRLNI